MLFASHNALLSSFFFHIPIVEQQHLVPVEHVRTPAPREVFRIGLLVINESSVEMTQGVCFPSFLPHHLVFLDVFHLHTPNNTTHSWTARSVPLPSTCGASGLAHRRSSSCTRTTRPVTSSRAQARSSRPAAASSSAPTAAPRSSSSPALFPTSFVTANLSDLVYRASSLTCATRTQPPFVSFTASGVALGDRARFPMFHRLAASDSAQVGAIAAVLRSLNVTAAALLAISDVYGLFAMSLLDAALRSAGVAAAHRQFFSPSLRITSTTDTEPLRATVSVSRSPVLSVPSRLSHTYCVVLFSAARCCRVQRHHRRHVLSLALVLSRSPACRVCPFPLHLFCSP